MNQVEAPAWSARLGILAILFGLLYSASSANEFMKFSIVGAPPFTVTTMPEPDCEADELHEENLSLTECRQLAFAVHDVSISSPAWFIAFYKAVSVIGAVVAFLSVVIGIALIDGRRKVRTAAIAVFAALAIVDALSFMAVVNTGPLLRQMYLWDILLWIVIHGSMALAAVVAGSEATPDNRTVGA